MFSFLSYFFQKKQINMLSILPLSAARITRPYLLERCAISDGSVILFAVPYLTPASQTAERNLSAYAVSEDYHLFFAELFEELLPILKERYPQFRFCAFADHSPIDEVDAAARAGLGIIGDNGLLITETYSSYVFLGEIITDAVIDTPIHEIAYCLHCGACKKACPMTKGALCLSSLTQKKGDLAEEESELLTAHSLVWGCDICQEVCPYTKHAIAEGSIYTDIPFFYASPLPTVTRSMINNMNDAEFSRRAYAWRKRETILRNLKFKEEKKQC